MEQAVMGPTIETEADIAEGVAALSKICPRLAHAASVTGMPPLRRHPDGFTQLLNTVISQQVSVASAKAIWRRLEEEGFTDEDRILSVSDDELRDCGLSRQKVRYVKSIASAKIDYRALRNTPDCGVISTLRAIPGIGPWTAEIYTMLSLGRKDVFPHGDLALQEAVKVLFEMEERPSESDLRKIAEKWSPWRSVAARLLWAYYRVVKDREGIR